MGIVLVALLIDLLLLNDAAVLRVGGAQTWAVNSRQVQDATLTGVWEKRSGDARTHLRIVLLLRSNGTYKKMLDAVVDGIHYGGTHEGRWTAKGAIVYLSGDDKWPAYSHDLAEFHKQANP